MLRRLETAPCSSPCWLAGTCLDSRAIVAMLAMVPKEKGTIQKYIIQPEVAKA